MWQLHLPTLTSLRQSDTINQLRFHGPPGEAVMMTSHWSYLANPYQPNGYACFRDYVLDEMASMIWFLRPAAEARWVRLLERYPVASLEELGARLHRWWAREIREFTLRLRQEWYCGKAERNKGRLRRARARIADLETNLGEYQADIVQLTEQCRSLEVELDQAKLDLEIEKNLTRELRDQWHCRKCNADAWEAFGPM